MACKLGILAATFHVEWMSITWDCQQACSGHNLSCLPLAFSVVNHYALQGTMLGRLWDCLILAQTSQMTSKRLAVITTIKCHVMSERRSDITWHNMSWSSPIPNVGSVHQKFQLCESWQMRTLIDRQTGPIQGCEKEPPAAMRRLLWGYASATCIQW